MEHKFEWEKLVAKKVSSKNCAVLLDYTRTAGLGDMRLAAAPCFSSSAGISQLLTKQGSAWGSSLPHISILHFLHASPVPDPTSRSGATSYCRLQTKEVTRLNHVYLKLLRDAGVEVIGEPLPCLDLLADQPAFRLRSAKASN